MYTAIKYCSLYSLKIYKIKLKLHLTKNGLAQKMKKKIFETSFENNIIVI